MVAMETADFPERCIGSGETITTGGSIPRFWPSGPALSGQVAHAGWGCSSLCTLLPSGSPPQSRGCLVLRNRLSAPALQGPG